MFRQLIDNISSGKSAIRRSSGSWLFVALLFLGPLLIVPAVGFVGYSLQRDQVRDDALADLRTIASLKAGQIEHWLANQRANAQVFAADSAFVDLVHASDATVPARQALIAARLAAVRQAYGYSAVALFDPAGRPLRIVGDYSAAGSPLLRQLSVQIPEKCRGCA